METEVFDPSSASQADLTALNAFERRMYAEAWPDDPPLPLDETVHDLRSVSQIDVPLGLIGAAVEISVWAIRNTDGSIVASARLVSEPRTNNQHVAVFDIRVLPHVRRRHIASELLGLVVGEASVQDRRLLLTMTDATVPAGEAFVHRLGGRTGLVWHTLQLDLAELDRSLLQHWQRRARQRATGFELGVVDGAYQEEAIGPVAAMMTEVMNAEPTGHLDIEDETWTPAQVRQIEAFLQDRNIQRWTTFASRQETGELVGFTEVFWKPTAPETLFQGFTGVATRYRNRGLGRWLKAEMLERVLDRLPRLKSVRTANAGSNTAMLHINREIGFKPHKTATQWQVELGSVREYLASGR